jgi:hypothetical protein
MHQIIMELRLHRGLGIKGPRDVWKSDLAGRAGIEALPSMWMSTPAGLGPETGRSRQGGWAANAWGCISHLKVGQAVPFRGCQRRLD